MRSPSLRHVATLVGLLAAATSLGEDQPRVLDHGVLRLRAPQLGAGTIERAAVIDGFGQLVELPAQSLTRLEDGWVAASLPTGDGPGTLLLVVGGVEHRFQFQSTRSPPRAQSRGNAATRSACQAIAGSWLGALHGNDPDVSATVSIELDRDCRTAHGILHWRSATSGTNDRVFAGTFDVATRTLAAADVALNQPAPKGGWRFCRIDRYELALSADGSQLTGTYFSQACADTAKVELRRPEGDGRK